MERWHLPPTYALIRKRFGAQQERIARESIRSALDRQEFASYHYTEVVRLKRGYERRYLTSNLLIDLHGQDGHKRRDAFERFIVKVGAHAIATVQSLHAIPDVLAHALHYATGANLAPRPMASRSISARTVASSLQKDVHFKSLSSLLAGTQSSTTWSHLSALSNLAKHRSVIRTALNEDFTGTRKELREVHFKSCEYDGAFFPAISLQALLEPAYDQLMTSTLSIGHELTSCLRREAA